MKTQDLGIDLASAILSRGIERRPVCGRDLLPVIREHMFSNAQLLQIVWMSNRDAIVEIIMGHGSCPSLDSPHAQSDKRGSVD